MHIMSADAPEVYIFDIYIFLIKIFLCLLTGVEPFELKYQ